MTGRFMWGDRGMKPIEKGEWFFYRCAKCGFKVPKYQEDAKDGQFWRCLKCRHPLW